MIDALFPACIDIAAIAFHQLFPFTCIQPDVVDVLITKMGKDNSQAQFLTISCLCLLTGFQIVIIPLQKDVLKTGLPDGVDRIIDIWICVVIADNDGQFFHTCPPSLLV